MYYLKRSIGIMMNIWSEGLVLIGMTRAERCKPTIEIVFCRSELVKLADVRHCTRQPCVCGHLWWRISWFLKISCRRHPFRIIWMLNLHAWRNGKRSGLVWKKSLASNSADLCAEVRWHCVTTSRRTASWWRCGSGRVYVAVPRCSSEGCAGCGRSPT